MKLFVAALLLATGFGAAADAPEAARAQWERGFRIAQQKRAESEARARANAH